MAHDSCPTCQVTSSRYRFVFTETRGPRAEGVQLSDVALFDKQRRPLTLATQSSGDVDIESAGLMGQLALEVSNTTTHQWYSGAIPAALDLTLRVPAHVAAYELRTHAATPQRDPISWLFGAVRDDGRFVVLRSVARAEPPNARLASYGLEVLGALVQPGAIVPGAVSNDAAVGPAGNCSELLLVLLRGEAYRLGDRDTREHAGDATPQHEALRALSQHVVRPAVRRSDQNRNRELLAHQCLPCPAPTPTLPQCRCGWVHR